MSKMHSDHTQDSDDELLAEYRFDYQKAKPNRFAVHSEMQKHQTLRQHGLRYANPSYAGFIFNCAFLLTAVARVS